MTDSGAPLDSGGYGYEGYGHALDVRSGSICDAVSIGVEKRRVLVLLSERKLSHTEAPAGSVIWVIEESNAQCKLWFDKNSPLTKKRKIFVAR